MIEGYRRRRIYGACLVVLGCLFFAGRGYHDQTLVVQSRDFKPVYGGARCLIDGCDPYDLVQVESAYARQGGNLADLVPFQPFYAGYPPSALSLVIPLALLPFDLARMLWLGTGILLFSCAALCMADLCGGRHALWVQGFLAAFVATSTLLIMLAQPSMISISLTVIATWCFLRRRYVVPGILAFAMSLTLKPQVGGLVWLFFLLSAGTVAGDREMKAMGARGWSFRRLAVTTLVATVVLMIPGILLAFHNPASAHWPQELHANLVGIAARGGLCNPGPMNVEAQSITSLQTIFSLIRDVPRFYDLAAHAVFALLFLVWVTLLRRPGTVPPVEEDGRAAVAAKDLLALAAAAALTFLPVYHRQYDTRLMLLMFPAVAVLASSHRWMGRAAVVLTAVATLTLSHQFDQAGPWLVKHGVTLPGPVWLIFYRPLPLTLLLLTCFFIYGMFRLTFKERQG